MDNHQERDFQVWMETGQRLGWLKPKKKKRRKKKAKGGPGPEPVKQTKPKVTKAIEGVFVEAKGLIEVPCRECELHHFTTDFGTIRHPCPKKPGWIRLRRTKLTLEELADKVIYGKRKEVVLTDDQRARMAAGGRKAKGSKAWRERISNEVALHQAKNGTPKRTKTEDGLRYVLHESGLHYNVDPESLARWVEKTAEAGEQPGVTTMSSTDRLKLIAAIVRDRRLEP